MVINDVASQNARVCWVMTVQRCNLGGSPQSFFMFFLLAHCIIFIYFLGESLRVKENKVYPPLSLQGFISALFFWGGDGAIGGRYFT